jgi:hypothetical protein
LLDGISAKYVPDFYVVAPSLRRDFGIFIKKIIRAIISPNCHLTEILVK